MCQVNFMQVLFQKIDRRSKPIRKKERFISHNLKRKRIYLEQENFDIISILKEAARTGNSSEKNQSSSQSKKNDVQFKNPGERFDHPSKETELNQTENTAKNKQSKVTINEKAVICKQAEKSHPFPNATDSEKYRTAEAKVKEALNNLQNQIFCDKEPLSPSCGATDRRKASDEYVSTFNGCGKLITNDISPITKGKSTQSA